MSAAGRLANNSAIVAPRFLIVSDHTPLARSLEQHLSIVFPDAECRIHAPKHSGRFHSAFTAVGYDAVLLDHSVENDRGIEWLENLLHRPEFPPVLFVAPGEDPALAARAVDCGAIDSLVRERIETRRMASALKDAVQRRRHDVALLRTGSRLNDLCRFGPITILGHRFVKELATGGTSMVYLAESERAGEMVVLKVLRDEPNASSHTQFQRFLQEYELISKIRHPNVVRIVDLGIADDHAYIAMEYFARGDLRSQISQGIGSLQALNYLAQMASALDAVHGVGVLHRDLKPGNIMVRTDDSIAIIDFGLAKRSEQALEITGAGIIFGTPFYMSPEQGHGRDLDVRSDLYSLGVVFYEMLTGRKPFVAPTPMAVIYMHGNAPVPVLNEPLDRLQPLIDRLLAKDPNDRFASSTELIAAIAAIDRTGLE
ncbi:MAG TPA: protein kinase [Steroidobacteraceae bacterium]|nr:protein kinase [Steroidobacteraceae bacterium]